MNPLLVDWFVLPVLIFLARVLDVSLGTLRIVFVARGKRYLAPMLGFVEVLIWIIAISQIMQNLSNVACYLAYAAGFAAGNYLGLVIENRLALGTLIIRMIVSHEPQALAERLRQAGYGVTQVDGQGATGPVQIIYTVIRRKNLPDVTRMIEQVHPKTFFSVEEVRSSYEGIFPIKNRPRTPLLKRK